MLRCYTRGEIIFSDSKLVSFQRVVDVLHLSVDEDVEMKECIVPLKDFSGTIVLSHKSVYNFFKIGPLI